ncbi:MAG: hypothetical protein ABR582_17020 [Gemmatimonadaceae bacterium]
MIPSQPSEQVDDGIFTVAVAATNPNGYPVVVTLDPLWLGRGFFFVLHGTVGGIGLNERIWDPSLTYFRAGEIKQQYFDLSLTNAHGALSILPGEYSLEGGYDAVLALVPNVVLQ